MSYDEITEGLPRNLWANADSIAEEVLNLHPVQDDNCLPLFDLAKLDGPPPPTQSWLLRDLIPEGEVTLFTGPGGDGKSLFAQQLATCAAARRSFLGMETDIGPDGAVLYLTCEEGEDELHRRQLNINQHLSATPADLTNRLFLSSLRGRDGNELATFDSNGEIEKTEGWRKLFATVVRTGPNVVILDNVAHLFAGNENDRGQVTRFVNLLYGLVRKLGCTIILIGHPNKSGDAYSGSTAWLNAVRSQIEITRVKDDSGFVADQDRRVIRSGKANYARKGSETYFRWHNHAFILESELPSDARHELAETIRVQGENSAFIACLRAREEQGEGRQVGPSPGPNYAPTQFEGMREAKGLKRPVLKRAMDRLFAIGEIESHTYRNKAKGRDVTVLREAPRTTPNAHPERSPNTNPELPELPARTTPHTHCISKDISGAGPTNGPPPLLGDSHA